MNRTKVDIITHFYERFARGDLESLNTLLADDFVFVPAGRACSLAGERRGRDALLQFTRQQRDITCGTWVPHPYDVLSSDSHVAVLVTVDARRGERSALFRLVHAWRIEHGLATELRSYVDDQYAYDQFFAD